VILGTGFDLTALPRIHTLLEKHGERFLARILTAREMAALPAEASRRTAYVAGRWAAMERAEGVRLIFGLGAYRIGEGDGCEEDAEFWQSGSSLAAQAQLGRRLGADGFALYRYDFLFKNPAWAELAAREAAALAALS